MSDKSHQMNEYLDNRIAYLKDKIKRWPSKSSVCRCAQARLHEIKALKKKYEESGTGSEKKGEKKN